MTALTAALIVPAAPLAAQSLSGAFDQIKVSPDTPIKIESDKLTVRQKERKAVFSGNVRAARGPVLLTTKRLVVEYAERGKGGSKSRTEITKLDARGGVKVVSRNQSATGEWAVMDVRTSKITLGGNVVLRQGETVIRGSRLDIDLRTGRSNLAGGGGGGGRVRGVFMPARRSGQ